MEHKNYDDDMMEMDLFASEDETIPAKEEPVNTEYRQEAYQYQNEYSYSKPQKRQSNNTSSLLIVVIAALIALIIVCVGALFIVKEIKSTPGSGPVDPVDIVDTTGETVETPIVEGEEPLPALSDQEKVENAVNSFIEANASHSNMSVSIVDNRTGARYTSQSADSSYTAWGLYLPVYIVYGQYSGYDWSTREGIMSSDAGVSNRNANAAIRHIGSLNAITNRICEVYGATGTSYGRFFGDTSSASDNYTTANDAVIFLKALNDSGDYSKLSYNTASFNIYGPSNASVYAHVGTENRNVRNHLNIFAIVKGARSDYSVAILSRSGQGRHISQLMQTIHDEMENR